MSNIDKKQLKIKLYDSDTDTETEVKTTKKNEPSRPPPKTTPSKNKITSDDDDDIDIKTKDGRRSRTDQVPSGKLKGKYSDDDADSKTSSKRSDQFAKPIKSAVKKIINHFSRSNDKIQSDGSSSSSERINKNPHKSNDRSRSSSSRSYSDTSIRDDRKVDKDQRNIVKVIRKPDNELQLVKKSPQLERPKTAKVTNIKSKNSPSSNSSKQSSKITSNSSTSSSSSSSSSSSRTSSSSSSSTSRSSSSDSKQNSKRKTSKKNSQPSDEESSSQAEASAPIKVNIERKPPIYKRQPKSLEKPGKDESSSTETDSTERQQRETGRSSDRSSNEMTDVSPLSSPKKSVSSSKRRSKQREEENGKDTDRIDTTVFYNALNNGFSKRMTSALENLSGGKLSRPASSKLSHSSSNLFNQTFDLGQSFYGSKLMRLEAENKKLYEKFIRENRKLKKSQTEKPIRLTSAALNRQREQKRIERENQLILKRILDAKPSRSLIKEEQIKDYERNFGYLSLKMSTSSPSDFTSNTPSHLNRSHLSSKRSSNKSTANNSRVSSAKSTMTTKSQFSLSNLDANEFMKRTVSLSRRPEWNDRW